MNGESAVILSKAKNPCAASEHQSCFGFQALNWIFQVWKANLVVKRSSNAQSASSWAQRSRRTCILLCLLRCRWKCRTWCTPRHQAPKARQDISL